MSNRKSAYPAVILATLIATSCGKGGEAPSDPSCDSNTAGKSFVTYNTAMGAHGMVPMTSLRAPHVVQALALQPFDVACLQEVWTPAHAREVMEGIGLKENQAFYFDTTGMREGGQDVCTEAQLAGVAECARKKCSKQPATEEVSICVREECGSTLRGIFGTPGGPECVNCLVAMAGKSVEEIGETCTGDGASRIQDGGSSAMLVSKTGRLYGKEPLLLASSGSNRTALFATVRMEGSFGRTQEVEVACAHISASTGDIPPTHSGYDTWDAEKRGQVEAIVAKLTERAYRADGSTVPMVFLGDFNAGPETSADTWDAVTAAGFICPTADPRGECSSCGVNTLVGGDRQDMIDHVCYRNPEQGEVLTETCSDRLFDQAVTIEGYDGVTEVKTHLSDHYGKRTFLNLVPAQLRSTLRL